MFRFDYPMAKKLFGRKEIFWSDFDNDTFFFFFKKYVSTDDVKENLQKAKNESRQRKSGNRREKIIRMNWIRISVVLLPY